VHFRQRIEMDLVNQINKKIVKEAEEEILPEVEEKGEGENQLRLPSAIAFLMHN
jgi:hypothetical protein